jgi:Cof subfamily protein (haloacid dehalogenase superfamily)
MIRLLATDLDGTLLRMDGTISARTRAALQAAESAGLVIVFVTGRPVRWLDDVIEQTGHLGVAVGGNGAIVYDLHDAQVLAAHPLAPDDARKVAVDIRRRFPEVAFASESLDGFAAEPAYVHDWAINPNLDRYGRPLPKPAVGDLETVTGQPLLKLLAKDRGADVDEFLTSVDALLAGRATATHSSSFGLLEISAPGISKATGLAEVAALHGIEREEIAAIGDMPNDIPMLEWVGTSYAVSNGHPAARAAAQQVVGSNDDDAVASVIESILARQG